MFTHKNITLRNIASVLCLIGTIGFAQAETNQPNQIYAEGVAEIMHGDRDAARQRALTDALNQASLSIEARVMATERLDASNLLQSQQIRPARQVSKYAILREWEDQALYYVAVSADEMQDGPATENANSIRAVKKKITFTRFDAMNTVQLDDIRDIYSELPKNISSRMEAGGGYLASYIDGLIPENSEALQREAVMQIASETGAQFLVSGLILDAGITKKSGFIEKLFGKNKRHFKVKLTVYDGLTGVRLSSHILDGGAQGEVEIGRDKSFGGGAFLETESGRALDNLIDSATTNIRAALACLPFSAHVVHAAGKSVYLDAGAVSMLKVGDKLTLYNTALYLPIVTARGTELGVPEHPAATATLVKIQPLFSIGELPEDAAKLGVKTGSIARFEFPEKRLGSPACLQ